MPATRLASSRPRSSPRASRRCSAGPPWLFVERKGPSVAFHVRQAEDRVAARAAVEAAIETVDRELPPHDLAHYRGRLVVDLRPRSAGGKREAFEELLAELRPATVVAFGDDVSDADGFAVLRAARDAGRASTASPSAVTGPHGMPDEVRAAADVVLDDAVRGGPGAVGARDGARTRAERPSGAQIQSILRSTTRGDRGHRRRRTR